jgi:hypothetical protein
MGYLQTKNEAFHIKSGRERRRVKMAVFLDKKAIVTQTRRAYF